MKNIYDPKFIEELFDTMSDSYESMNYFTSFGFSRRWRKQFIQQSLIKPGDTVADLLTGMGECWSAIIDKTGNQGKIIALDFSEGMLKYAWKRKARFGEFDIQILKENVFDNSILTGSIDAIVSGFGIKTFSPEQLKYLAKEFRRILKPNGCIAMIDVSVPSNLILRLFYMFYLKTVIPIIGRLFLGNPNSYKMLGVYTEKFKNAKLAAEIFRSEGYQVNYHSFYYGCASGISGRLSSSTKF